ncbi:MAG: FAD-binding oxidoreductase [Gemmatimonadota bacterium]
MVVSTARLGGITAHRARDLTVTVGAGLRVAELLAFLEARGQWVPVSGPGLSLSVGGLIAAAPPGPLDASFGPARRLLLECRMLSPVGTPLRWGRPVVKNVAGYDVQRLVCGSRGRLGVITEATLRVWPRPAERRLYELSGGPGAVELAARLALEHAGESPRPDGASWEWRSEDPEGLGHLRVELLGSSASVAVRERALLGWARRANARAERLSDSKAFPGRTTTPGDRHRPLERSVFRLTAARGYVAGIVRGARGAAGARIVRMEAYPMRGVVRLEIEREPGTALGMLGRALALLGPVNVCVERGSAAELARAEGRRPSAERRLEARVVKALGGWPRHWLADYL